MCVSRVLVLSLSMLGSTAWADPSALSAGSQLSAEGSATVYSGSLTAIEGSAEFTVASLQVIGDQLRIGLEGSATVGKLVLDVPIKASGAGSYAVGQSITLVAEGLGWLITRGGEVIGFIPKEVGKGLLHSKRIDPTL